MGRINLQGIFLVTLVVLIAFMLAGATSGVLYLKSLPSISQLEEYEPTLTSQIVSNDGVVIKTFGAYKYKKVNISQIPDNMKKAIISIEDKNFYSHQGFDLVALVRSTIKNIKAGKIVQGASTITQQITRILFLSQERTFIRKFKELVIAHRLEKTVTKDKILEMYLNNVYLGEGAYGVAAAADIYFDKKVEELTLPECALLAGLPQAPSIYTPYRNMKLSKKRRSMVLKRMLDDKYITKEQFKVANNSEVELNANSGAGALKKAPYFVDFVMKELAEKTDLSEQEVIQGGYKIYTTLNYKYQKAAEKSLQANLKGWKLKEPDEQAALLSYDVVSGQVMAYIGGKDYSQSQFDRVSQAVRQPGSSFKMFVYATAMESGLTPFDIYPDEPYRIGDWAPQNYGRKYRGPLPLYKALAVSSNVIAANLTVDLGTSEVIRTARKMGLTTPIARDPTISLGSNGVKMIELASAYGILANGGVKVQPYAIEKIETANGNLVYLAHSEYKRILDVKTVAYMVEMLKQVVKYGTGRASQIGRPSAGKTGTTDSYRDAWFVGFTPDIVTAVWTGRDTNKPSSKRLTGGSLPAVIWRDYMKVVTANRPVMDFLYPEIIVDTNYEMKVTIFDEEDLIIEDEEERKKRIEEKKKKNNWFEINEKPERPTDTTPKRPNEKNNKNNLEKQLIQEIPEVREFSPIPLPAKKIKVKVKNTAPIPEKREPNYIDFSGF